MSPASGNGSGRRTTALTMLNTIAFAPMPRPRMAAAVRAKTGVRRSDRSANRKSRSRRPSIGSFDMFLRVNTTCVLERFREINITDRMDTTEGFRMEELMSTVDALLQELDRETQTTKRV